ncbi:TRAP transporter solute receptor, TAXI family precursor [Candidatus Syntrophocurvum alkaliphilum]|uniref:TRAP transporter solute receptor, TAXI family n=1 Tax=Candidatus Syntrophocurvum alkaliphilum TaxID=2293317 RepID=A0A6I6DE57_9FIRM|nr:TAXI family TRAP transporter solute-binding subunit [Candidatus Syntrophocurvum alkaliphilum]QGT99457.1 TRAP transporter solute receptor, TAXI family precursor [Candidatus Syntrophocurvum alkaliphilum]
MRKKLVLVAILTTFVFIAAACGGGGSQQITMGTGSVGGTYYPLGQEMVTVWNNNIEDVNFSAVESGASVQNLADIGAGNMDLGMSVHIPALNALAGINDFDNEITNFNFIGHIYPEVLQVITREGTGIESISDLEGKRVAIGPAGSGTQAATRLVLEAYGLTEDDYDAYQEGFGDAADRLQDGTIDASFGLLGLPNGTIEQLQASVGDVQFINISTEGLQYVEENSDYGELTIAGGTYDWIEEDVITISAFAVLVANTDTVDDELAYELARVMVENADENTHPQSAHMTLENALLGSEGLPMHPGAERYYQEQGILE